MSELTRLGLQVAYKWTILSPALDAARLVPEQLENELHDPANRGLDQKPINGAPIKGQRISGNCNDLNNSDLNRYRPCQTPEGGPALKVLAGNDAHKASNLAQG